MLEGKERKEMKGKGRKGKDLYRLVGRGDVLDLVWDVLSDGGRGEGGK